MKENNKILPKGFLLMDTNCLLSFIEGGLSDVFDYRSIEKTFIKNGWVLLITPYTLWEIIQRCVDLDFIKKRREELLSKNIWVVNVEGVLNSTNPFLLLSDILNEICFNPNTMHEYADKRREFRIKVYELLFYKIIALTQIIAFIYLTITERKDDGTYPERFDYRLGAVINYFKNHDNLKSYLTLFLRQADGLSYFDKNGILHKPLDAKDYLKDEIEELVIIIIATSKVLEDHRCGINTYSDEGEYYLRINNECKRIKSEGLYKRADMVKCYKAFLKVEPSRTIETIVEEIFMKGPDISLQMYIKLLSDWFTPSGTGKQLMNTLIDYTNTDILFTSGLNNIVYLTEEKKIIKALISTHDEACDASRVFYKKFYLGKNINTFRNI